MPFLCLPLSRVKKVFLNQRFSIVVVKWHPVHLCPVSALHTPWFMRGAAVFCGATCMASGGCSFTTILRTLGGRHGGWSGPAVTPQAQENLFCSCYIRTTLMTHSMYQVGTNKGFVGLAVNNAKIHLLVQHSAQAHTRVRKRALSPKAAPSAATAVALGRHPHHQL